MVKEVVVAIDQSGSMAESVVYAAVFGATLASIRSIKTSVVAFDTEIADLTDQLSDPVDVLFGCQLGGGTDINRALAYCQQLITRPTESILVLISDLYEGGIAEEMLRRVAELLRAGVTVVVLLALSDSGAPAYDHEHAAALAALGSTGLCVYAGPVPRPARCRGQQGRHRPVGCHCRQRRRRSQPSCTRPPGVASAVRGSAP